MSENRLLRKIFRVKIDEVAGEWRGLHNKELHELQELPDMHSSPPTICVIKSRILRSVGQVARMAVNRNAYMVLVGKLGGGGGKRSLARSRRR